MRKFFSYLICCTLFISSISFGCFSTAKAATIVESGSCGENVTYTLDSEGLLTISGTGEMQNYNDDDYSRFCWNQSVKTVIIEQGVTTIGDRMFVCCDGITSITIPNSVISIGNEAVYNCNELINVTIPGSVTSIGNDAFCGCSKLSDVIIPDSVTSIGSGAFCSCTSLKSVKLSSSITSLESSVFSYCAGLTSITLPDSLQSIDRYAFSGCTGLKSIVIPKNVTSIGDSAFEGCSGIESIKVAKGNKKYHSAGNCLIETESKEIVSGCKNSVIPDDGSVTSIGWTAFNGCTGLTELYIPGNIYHINGMSFANCTGLKKIEVSPENRYYYSSGNCIIDTQSDSLVLGCKTSIIPDDGSVTEIDNYAFAFCTELTSIVIPDSVTSIGYTAFISCDNLSSIRIPETTTAIDDTAFFHCEKLSIYGVEGSYAQTYAEAHGIPFFPENKTSPPDPAGSITVSSAYAEPGGTVSLKVTIDGNPGINTFSLGFDYDTEKLKLVKVEVSPKLSGQFVYEKKAVWLGNADTEYNGEILTLTFKVKENAAEGTANVAVTYAPGDIANYAEEDVDFALLAGHIEITAADDDNDDGKNDPDTQPDSNTEFYITCKGDTFVEGGGDLTVYLNGNGLSGLKSLKLELSYNSDILEFLSGTGPARQDTLYDDKDSAISISATASPDDCETKGLITCEFESDGKISDEFDCTNLAIYTFKAIKPGDCVFHVKVKSAEYDNNRRFITKAGLLTIQQYEYEGCVCSAILGIPCDLDEGEIKVPSTCSEEGIICYTCTRCATRYTSNIETDPNNHTGETVIKNKKAATCGKAGNTGDTYCADCGAKISSGKTVKATGKHTWDAGKVTKAATCTATGEKTYTCTVCKKTKTEEIKATGHKYGEWTVVSAEGNGKEERVCSVCGDIDSREVLKPLPVSAGSITVSSTDAAPGDTVSLKVSIDGNPGINTFALGFDYNTEILELIKVGFSRELGGSFTYSKKAVWSGSIDSKYNGEILTLIFKVKKNVEVGKTEVAVTYTSGDISNCDGKDVDFALHSGSIGIWPDNPICPCNVLGIKHTWDDGKIVHAATCTAEGEIIYTCTVCDQIKTEEIKATGHKYGEWTVVSTEGDGKEERVCSVCGVIDSREFLKPLPVDTKTALGDVSGDGKILADDARLALRCSAKLEKLSESQILAADVNEDGQVLASDARQILRYSAKLQKTFEKAKRT